jgi:hypothetical protein
MTAGRSEAVNVDGLVAGEMIVGRKGATVYGIPRDRLRAILEKHGRLDER